MIEKFKHNRCYLCDPMALKLIRAITRKHLKFLEMDSQ
jgi:hypothetical protein